jgi:hypothetical protein
LIPAHQVERDTGTNSSTWRSRSRRPQPISLGSGRAASLISMRAIGSDFAGLVFDAVMAAFNPRHVVRQSRTTNAQNKKALAPLLSLGPAAISIAVPFGPTGEGLPANVSTSGLLKPERSNHSTTSRPGARTHDVLATGACR